jgi:hypothetical protein
MIIAQGKRLAAAKLAKTGGTSATLGYYGCTATR